MKTYTKPQVKRIVKEAINRYLIKEAFKSSKMQKISKYNVYTSNDANSGWNRRSAFNMFNGLSKLGIKSSDVTDDMILIIPGDKAKSHMTQNKLDVVIFVDERYKEIAGIMRGGKHVHMSGSRHSYGTSKGKSIGKQNNVYVSTGRGNAKSNKTGISSISVIKNSDLMSNKYTAYVIKSNSDVNVSKEHNKDFANSVRSDWDILRDKHLNYAKKIAQMKKEKRKGKMDPKLAKYVVKVHNLKAQTDKAFKYMLDNPELFSWSKGPKELLPTYINVVDELSSAIKDYNDGKQIDYHFRNLVRYYQTIMTTINAILTKK